MCKFICDASVKVCMLSQFYLKLALLLIFVMVQACTNLSQSGKSSPPEKADYRSILVVPVVNNSVEIGAEDRIVTLIPEILIKKGFYVFPIHTTRIVLEQEGLYEPAEIHKMNPQSLATMFGAEAILYVSIERWAAEYTVINTTTVVDLKYSLVRADGEAIWSTNKRMSRSPDVDYGGGDLVADVITSMLAAAIERGAPNYDALARRATLEALRELPNGPYMHRN